MLHGILRFDGHPSEMMGFLRNIKGIGLHMRASLSRLDPEAIVRILTPSFVSLDAVTNECDAIFTYYYSKPSHEGYKNTIELPEGNNVVPLRSDTIRLVHNGCSFHRLRSGNPNQHLKDFLKLIDSLDLDVANKERTRLRLFQFSYRDQASNWLKRLPAGSISIWEDLTTRFLVQFFPPGRTEKLCNDILMFQQHQGESISKCEIHRAAGDKLRDKNVDESWEIIENLALYDHEGWNDSKDSVKPVKAISTPEGTSKTPDRRLLELEDQINFLLKGMEWFKNAIFKQREEINDKMKEMFGLLKELTTSKAPEKVLIKKEAKLLVTKNVNSISLIKKKNEAENGTKNKPIKSDEKEPTQVEEEESAEAPRSYPVGYYVKHIINEKLIEGLAENHRFNDSLSAARVEKTK
nr:MAK10-like protein [Tanacetum cinerariifolium]